MSGVWDTWGLVLTEITREREKGKLAGWLRCGRRTGQPYRGNPTAAVTTYPSLTWTWSASFPSTVSGRKQEEKLDKW